MDKADTTSTEIEEDKALDVLWVIKLRKKKFAEVTQPLRTDFCPSKKCYTKATYNKDTIEKS